MRQRAAVGLVYPLQCPRVTCLFECLVQIRALRDTAQRLQLFAARAVAAGAAGPAAALLRQRLQLELAHGEWLGLLLGDTAVAPAVSLGEPGAAADAAVEAFLAAREASLGLLERLDAAELERSGRLPDGRPASVTDVVAFMVAADTEAAAALRDLVPVPRQDSRGGP